MKKVLCNYLLISLFVWFINYFINYLKKFIVFNDTLNTFLAMFIVASKIFELKKEKEKWRLIVIELRAIAHQSDSDTNAPCVKDLK